MATTAHIAIDLGAESGRVMLGILDDAAGGRLQLRECRRFEHLPLPTPSGLTWDLTGLWRSILDGLADAARAAKAEGVTIETVGVDTWGVDFAFVDDSGVLLGLPLCYREPAFGAAFERAIERVGRRGVYDATGIQLMSINSLYQYQHRAGAGAVPDRATLLFMPDLFHWLLSGRRVVERTIASTSQMLDARTGDWNRRLIESLGLPVGPLGAIVAPGSVIGPLRPAVAERAGLPASVRVVAPPAHDTASAVAAVPVEPGNDGWCYLSSGTWSLLGAELPAPVIDNASFAANFTNELGVGGTVRFLKNIAGLWLVQECRRQWSRDAATTGAHVPDYAELTRLADAEPPLRTLVPVNDPAFAAPGDMPGRIAAYARQTAQPIPERPGAFVRCCLESLALEYRRTVAALARLTGRSFKRLHVIGGGGKNALLNRMTADATGLSVVAGPSEATAVGNLLVQAMGVGRVRDVPHLRAIVRAGADLAGFEPSDPAPWSSAARRYDALPAMRPA